MAKKINELLEQEIQLLFPGQGCDNKNRVYFEIGAKWAIQAIQTFCEAQIADEDQSDGENIDHITNFLL